MFWWRGNGLMIGLLASLPAVAVTQAGASYPALAYAASAAMIFLMRGTLGAESSLFSIPTRFWPPLLLIVALIVQFSPASDKKSMAKNDLLYKISEIQASLPLRVGEQVRLDRVELQGSTLNGHATSMGTPGSVQAKRVTHEQALRQHYCEKLDYLWKANIGLSVKINVPPKTLSDRVETFMVSVSPPSCQAAPR